ncbi:Hypothetical predicted protein, partial [Mytilus galloprovincialis]
MILEVIYLAVNKANEGECERNIVWVLTSFLSLLWIIASSCIDYWLTLSVNIGNETMFTNQGLWKLCIKTSDVKCCGYGVMEEPSFIHWTRALVILVLLTQIFIMVFAYIDIYSRIDFFHVGTTVFVVFSEIFAFLAITIYGAAFDDNDATNQYSLSGSYWAFLSYFLIY